jgi:RHS repeat-associated protein
MLRRGRRMVAVILAPVLAGGMSLAPAAVAAATVAGAAVVSVAAAAPAKAATTGPVLVLLQGGETTAPETTIFQNAGYSVTQVTPSAWAAMSAAQFKAYAALVIGDPSSGTCSASLPTTATLGTTWQTVLGTGNIAVLGTAPALAGTSGANALVKDAASYATATYSSTGQTGTGLYLSLNCAYSATSSATAVSLLNGVQGIGTAGGINVQGGLSCSDPGTVNTWEAEAAGTFSGFTSGSLATGSWPSPACPVQEAFDSWPAMFTPVAYDAAHDAAAVFTASDGAQGQPYVLLGAPVSSGTQALAPSTGGEVPAGTTTGGTSNPAAPGVSQASAGDPVNTENGDFTQSSTDLSIPTFGPSLDFTRSYDAQAAQQETVNGSPGTMGYGWTDNWASSLTQARPVPGDIYTLTGLRTDTGQGGPPAAAAVNSPGQSYNYGSDTYIADTGGNRVEEIPGTSKTQWGQPMTAGKIYTIAGSDTGAAGDSPNGTAAGQTGLDQPEGIALDSNGNLFIADTANQRVVEIPAVSGTYYGIPMTANDLYTIAGVPGTSGVGGDRQAAISSDLDQPWGLAVGPGVAEDVYIADAANNRIQEVSATSQNDWGQSMTTGDVYTVAGSSGGTSGTSGMGGAAVSAKLYHPESVAIKSTGLYIADTNNDQIAEVPLTSGAQWGVSPMTADDIYTIAGRDGQPAVGGDAKAATASDLDLPSAISLANGPNIYIADTANNRIQEVAGSGHTEWGQTMTAYYVYTVAGASSKGTSGDSGDGGAALSALMDAPAGVALDAAHDLLASDTLNNEVRAVNVTSANISDYAGGTGTFAQDGDNGTAALSGLDNPMQEAFDAQGDIYIADAGNNRIQEIAAYTHTQFSIPMTAGDIYTIAGQADGQAGCQCDGHPATQAYLNDPMGIVLDSAGDLYIADNGNNRIQEVPASGGMQWGQSMTAGYMYTVAGQQYGAAGDYGDGGPAASALLNHPDALAVDKAGDIYIVDSWNNRIQEVPVSSGLQWGQNMTAGDIYTVAGDPNAAHGNTGDGGPAASALLYGPGGITVDAAGDLFIGDGGNNRVQEVPAVTGTQYGQAMTAGNMYTLSGGTWGSAGDGGPATAATLAGPESMAVDPAGDIYFTDSGNNRIQEIAAASGTQWSQSMTADDIYTVAGSATAASGNTGDGGPATAALMHNTESISLDPAGDLYITDNTNNTIREVAAENASYIPGTAQEASALIIAQTGQTPAGITITQPGGAQITFYPKSGGNCASPYQSAGSYCTLPQDVGATLTTAGSGTGLTYTYTPSPGTTYTYNYTGQFSSQSDAAGDTLHIAYLTPAPGSGQCPSTANSCETITAASGRSLVIGSDASGLITSVTDPLGRQWTYHYSAGDLTSATDPTKGNITTYTYGQGTGNSNPQLANDLLTITSPNAQPGGPDAGDSTVNVYDSLGRVTSQTDPMGWKTTFNYTGFNPATGNGTITVTDPDSNTTVDDYEQGVLAAESKWTGSTLTSEQDFGPATTSGGTSGGTLLDKWIADANGNNNTYTYDSAGNWASETAPDGETSSGGGEQFGMSTQASTSLDLPDCSSDAVAPSTCQQDPAPAPVAHGQAISPPSQVPPQGVVWTLYDNYGNDLYSTAGVYEPGSNTAAYAQTTYQLFNGNSVTLPGASTAISCTANAPSAILPCATINASGVVTQLSYDLQGDLTSSSTPDGNASQLATTAYSFDADGEQTSTISPDGNLSGANAGNYTTTSAYNSDGEKTSQTQAGGSGATVTPRTTSYGYDADGNQTTVQDARSYTTTTTYNADDDPTLMTDPDGNATLTCYDGDGNAAQTVLPAGVATSNLTPTSCPTSYPAGYGDRLAADASVDTFNALSEKTQETTPLPAGQTGPPNYETTTYTYDGDGNLTRSAAPPTMTGGQPQVVTNTYTSAGKLSSQTLGSGSVASTVSYCYDPIGETTSVVYADGNISGSAPCNTNPASYPWIVDPKAYPVQGAAQTTYGYDTAGEMVSVTRPVTAAASSGAKSTYTYNAAGDTLTSSNPDGITATMTYTPGGQEASVSYSGSSAHQVTFTYDANGNMTATTDAAGTSSYSSDPFGELTSATNGASQVTGYGYDADGDVSSITYPLPPSATWATTHTVNYSRDHADELTGVTDFNGHQVTIANTADGLPSSVTLGSTGDTVATSYDSTDSAASILLKNSTTTLQSFGYTYSPAGTVLNEADIPSSSRTPAAYTYDNRGRVTSMTAGTSSALNYGFDASSSLTTLPTGASGSYDNAGELTSAAVSGTTTSYTYDASGQRVAAKQGTTTVASGSWNGAGQLTAYTDPAANMTAATYDASGHRASTTITPSGGSSTTQGYVWNGDSLLMDSTNTYIYTSGNAPAEQVNLATGTITYLSTDSLNSVRGTVNSSGALTGTTSYDAWGNAQTSGGLTATTPFGYAGGYTDPTGLIYLINRYYDPATGQFTSLDPQIDQTLQPYAYTAGNPVSESDPTGLAATGGCTNAVPSCRYERALNDTYHEMQKITGSRAFRAIRALNNEGFTGEAETAFGVYVRGGGSWDMKTHLQFAMGARESGEAQGFTRIFQHHQIYYNVWGNLLYGYIGLRENFTQAVLESGATSEAILASTNTPGNYIERHMGYDMYHRVGIHYTLTAINTAILDWYPTLGHYCDVEYYPHKSGKCFWTRAW